MAEKRYQPADAEAGIREFLDLAIEKAGFSLTYTISAGETPHPDFENPDFMVRFQGEDVDLLLANKAELLLALEHLTQESLGMSPNEHARICFDANDRRVLRIEELRMSAQAAAEKVKKTGHPFHFSPMNSRERRILHLALREEAEVRSESVGEGPIRQVVIVSHDAKTLPEPIRPPRPRPESDHGGRRGPGAPGGRGRDGRDRRGPRR